MVLVRFEAEFGKIYRLPVFFRLVPIHNGASFLVGHEFLINQVFQLLTLLLELSTVEVDDGGHCVLLMEMNGKTRVYRVYTGCLQGVYRVYTGCIR